ncbi:MAG: hypothetical protein KF861_04150 [Planctomycetaceae bacterium]|nr:hypothetical protein [Planctomycetaceae bacterium]
MPDDGVRRIGRALGAQHGDDPPLTGTWSVYRQHADGTRELIEADLPEEIARDMVADYEAEGESGIVAVEEQ